MIRLVALSTFEQSPISLAMAQRLFQGAPATGSRRVNADLIQKVVCEHFDITIEEIKSSRRQKMYVAPRQIAMYLTRELTEYSFPEIGSFFGGKDHSTIMHAYEKIKKQISEDENMTYTIKQLKEKIRG